jgi:hypothetical protein
MHQIPEVLFGMKILVWKKRKSSRVGLKERTQVKDAFFERISNKLKVLCIDITRWWALRWR